MGQDIKKKVVKLTEIHPNPQNTKKHPSWQIEKLVHSIRTYGYLQKIVVDENDMILIGHGRYEALKELSWDKCEVYVKEGLTPDQKTALSILDNKSVSMEWDEVILSKQLPDLADKALETGFSEKEIKEILAKVSATDIIDTSEPTFELTPRLYEKYNYILLHFDNEIDFLNATQMLKLRKMADRMKPTKVGLFRAIKGNEAIKLIQEAKREVPNPK